MNYHVTIQHTQTGAWLKTDHQVCAPSVGEAVKLAQKKFPDRNVQCERELLECTGSNSNNFQKES